MNDRALRLSVRYKVADGRHSEYHDWLQTHVLAAATAAPVTGFRAFCHPEDPGNVELLFEFQSRDQYEEFIDSPAFQPFEESLRPICASFEHSLKQPMAVPLKGEERSSDDSETRCRDRQFHDEATVDESASFSLRSSQTNS